RFQRFTYFKPPVRLEVIDLLEPGETVDLIIDLNNIGTISTGSFQANLSCNNNNVSIANPVISYPEILPEDIEGNSFEPFVISTNFQVYNGSMVEMSLNLTNEFGEMQNLIFMLDIGEVSISDPLGPDSYGYYFYDDEDNGYQDVPEYLWYETDPDFGGNGTDLQLKDLGNTGSIVDSVSLPFNMKFYDVDYDEITICSNGWIAPGITEQASFMNWQLPSTLGPSPIIAPFWDDLIVTTGKVLTYFNESANTFIVEWSHMQNEYNNAEETFQLIIYDADFYPTSNGCNKILFQYKVVNNVDQGLYGHDLVAHGQYATVGIEDQSGNRGLQYTYNNEYPTAAKPLQNEMAILLSPTPIIHEEAFLVIDQSFIQNDDNNNGNIDFGESFDLFVSLANVGENIAQNISCSISTDDEYLTILSSQSDYDDIEGSQAGLNLIPFALEASANAPDAHIAPVLMNIVTNENEWDLVLNIVINAPNIILESIMILDGNNGILDPSETADFVMNFLNIGGCNAYNLNSEISATNINISIDDNQFFLAEIISGATESAVYTISSNSNIQIGESFLISWNLTSEDYFTEGDEQIITSQIPVQLNEPFDQFPPLEWEVNGPNWLSTNTNYAGGNAPEMEFHWYPPTQGMFRFISKEINTLGSTTLNLNFRELIDHTGGGYYNVGIQTTKDGENWHTAWYRLPGSVNPTLTEIILDTPDVGSENFQFAFFFEGDTDVINDWIFDDVELTEVPVTPHSYIAGNVVINSDSLDVRQILISAGDHETTPDENGNYCLSIPIGTYNVRASFPGFISGLYEDIEITENWQTINLDFELSEISTENTPVNLSVTAFGDRIIVDWDIPGFNGRAEIVSNSKNTQKIKTIEQIKKDRNLTGYNIYKNGDFLINIDDFMITEYFDYNNPEGQYSYYVTAIYDEGESAPTAVVEIDFVLPIVQNLEASIGGNNAFILLTWDSPENCSNIIGFRVYKDGEFLQQTTAHLFVDNSVIPGFQTYEVTVLHGEHESQPTEVTIFNDVNDYLIPLITELNGNFPNPFNPETEIKFSLKESEHVILEIYNIKGAKIVELINDDLKAGFYNKLWNGKDMKGKNVASGIYFYRLKMNSYSKTRKMLMIK
ncbi:MAG: T9SS type A sorting domain-containing protein, partial [Candidatus Cloacimonetes bacterium]|nr:T9SS type A sorting domain-containing protein [Candidatus Cloacimonadota bacterium]